MPPKRRFDPKPKWRQTKFVVAGAVLSGVIAAAAIAATVSVSSQTASATWLGLTQPTVTVAPTLQDPVKVSAQAGLAVHSLTWGTVPNATAYRIWLDGTPNSVIKADVAPTEARLLAVSCGATHRWNVQGINGKSVGPIAAKPVYFTVEAC